METARPPELLTASLLLRSASIADAEALSALMTPEISRWLASWSYPLPIEAVAERIEACHAKALALEGLAYVIVKRVTEQVIGWISVQRSTNASNRGEISYWLGEGHHGKGYAREASSAMFKFASDHLNLDEIEAGAQVENINSFSVMTRCGMAFSDERMVYAPTRARHELCRFYLWRPQTQDHVVA